MKIYLAVETLRTDPKMWPLVIIGFFNILIFGCNASDDIQNINTNSIFVKYLLTASSSKWSFPSEVNTTPQSNNKDTSVDVTSSSLNSFGLVNCLENRYLKKDSSIDRLLSGNDDTNPTTSATSIKITASEGGILITTSENSSYPKENQVKENVSQISNLEKSNFTSASFRVVEDDENTFSKSENASSSNIVPDDLNPLAKVALSIPALQKFLNANISGLEASSIFFNHYYNILKHFRAPHYAENAIEISKDISNIKIFTLPLYFQVIGNTIVKFLYIEGIEISPIIIQNFANIFENTLISSTVNGSVSLYQALLKGFSNFISSLGFCDGTKADLLTRIFTSEILAISNI